MTLPPRSRPHAACTRRVALARVQALAAGGALAVLGTPAAAQNVDIAALRARRADGDIVLDYQLRLSLAGVFQDALQRGLPLYFRAEAALMRERWYWRDERISRVVRLWRLAYQPLTATWRVSLGGLSQSHASRADALETITRVTGWRLTEGEKLDAGERYHVRFSFRLDETQLPAPLLVDVGNDWSLGLERQVRVE